MRKGFTLFTALVGLIVIGIGVLIIQHTNNLEDTYNATIRTIQNQNEMLAIKDFLRLETLNLFNLILRAKFYDYFNASNQNIDAAALFIEDPEKKMDSYKEDFTKSVFFPNNNKNTTPFAGYVSNKIITFSSNFNGTIRNIYKFSIYDPARLDNESKFNNKPINVYDPSTKNTIYQQFLTKSLNEVFVKTNQKSGLLKILKCSNTSCDDGSFYIKADFSDISPQNYLYLPRIFIYNNKTLVSIDDAILPKSNLLFYVPLRIFHALYLSNKIINRHKNNLISKYKKYIKVESQLSDIEKHINNLECPKRFNIGEIDEMKEIEIGNPEAYKEIFNDVEKNIKIICRPKEDIVTVKTCTYDLGYAGSKIKIYFNKIRSMTCFVIVKETNDNYKITDNLQYAFQYNIKILGDKPLVEKKFKCKIEDKTNVVCD